MDFRLSTAEERFRSEVHAWLVANLPAGWGTPGFRKPEDPAEKVRFAVVAAASPRGRLGRPALAA